MIITIDHKTEYRYSDRVFLEPHTVRLLPRTDYGQRVLEKSLHVDPKPAGISEILDQDGTNAYLVWFLGMSNTLKVHSTVTVETREANPYDFLIYPNAGQMLPMIYSGKEMLALAPVLKSLAKDDTIPSFARSLAEEVQYKTIPFLSLLAQYVQKEFRYEERLEGEAQDAEVTFKNKRGCCRDFVVFTIAVCRQLNLATRFASGYYYSDDPIENRHMHAWIEVYLPGGGWRGYDPTHGIACYDRHITVATSSEPHLTMPVTGTYRGFANARMRVDLQLKQWQDTASIRP